MRINGSVRALALSDGMPMNRIQLPRMRVAAVEHRVPTECLTNDGVARELRDRNLPVLGVQNVDGLEVRVRDFLARAGTKRRHRVSAPEKPLELLLAAIDSALERARVPRDHIDFLIYTGVARGWVEPAMANVVQTEAGLHRATCFDVMDGCAGWLRALHIAHGFIRGGSYRTGLLVNCEAGVLALQKWNFTSDEEIDPYLATYTIGEAVTATIVTADDDVEDDFYFRFENFGEYFDLCMVPLATVEQFLPRSRSNGHQTNVFYAHSDILLRKATQLIVRSFESDPRLSQERYDIAFGHAASEKASDLVCAMLDFPREKFYSTHRNYGNTIAAAIPLAMSLAEKKGRLRRGNKVLLVAGASGITVGFASFTY